MRLRYLTCLGACLCLLTLATATRARAQQDPTQTGGEGSATFQFDGVTLNFVSQDPALTAETATNLVQTFGAVFGEQCAYFNVSCPTTIDMTVEHTLYCGYTTTVAGCADVVANDRTRGYIKVSGERLLEVPDDYDIVTHEAMHIVQGAPWGQLEACSYWVEGEADLGREWWGQNNEAANWHLPQPDANNTYQTQYGVNAAFLEWIYENWGDEPILSLHAALQAGQCPAQDFWAETTGFATIDDLWNGYVAGDATPPGETEEPGDEDPNDPNDPNEPDEPNDPNDPWPEDPEEPEQPDEPEPEPDEPEDFVTPPQ